MTLDLSTLTPAITTVALLLGVGWTIFRYGRLMLHKDFLTRAEFKKFVTEQKAHDKTQSSVSAETAKGLAELTDEVHQLTVNIEWIKISMQRLIDGQERLMRNAGD